VVTNQEKIDAYLEDLRLAKRPASDRSCIRRTCVLYVEFLKVSVIEDGRRGADPMNGNDTRRQEVIAKVREADVARTKEFENSAG
jgi:hypothetical protein